MGGDQPVIAVENRPLTLRTIEGIELDGYMANDLAGALRKIRPAPRT